jgi:hypothetical protein
MCDGHFGHRRLSKKHRPARLVTSIPANGLSMLTSIPPEGYLKKFQITHSAIIATSELTRALVDIFFRLPRTGTQSVREPHGS